jgi:hypothetical protein
MHGCDSICCAALVVAAAGAQCGDTVFVTVGGYRCACCALLLPQAACSSQLPDAAAADEGVDICLEQHLLHWVTV